jgi:acyl-CoA synthetase (AMP-forming)/AMP-acid ligase II
MTSEITNAPAGSAWEWNYADYWELIAERQPDAPAIIQGGKVWTWGQFNAGANALAAALLGEGLSRQSKVGAYLHNCPEYLITYSAAFKAGLVPFNTNYRYGLAELFYLFDNADAEAVVFHSRYTEQVDAIRERLPKVRLWIAVEEPGYPAPQWAASFANILAAGTAGNVAASWGRSPDDVIMLYTGGTTGMPKGVMWPLGGMVAWEALGADTLTAGLPTGLEQVVDRVLRAPKPTVLAACPLMHGTGYFAASNALSKGGAVVLLAGSKFDSEELWDAVERRGVTELSVVGLAFCLPMLDALDRQPGRWALFHLERICSSGAMWSEENKRGLLEHLPSVALVDRFASSEAFTMGASTMTAKEGVRTAEFALGASCAVFTEDGRRVAPGSGERGLVAVCDAVPIGYYKDPEKSARAFPIIDGRRWSIPGDWAEVNADGTLKLLGRGSQCINTGGEKVFPEEVEEALKRHPAVRDAAVVGVPDPRFGERVCALVERRSAKDAVTAADLTLQVRKDLADHKAPREVFFVDSVGRSPSGKLDYKSLKALAEAMVSEDRGQPAPAN